MGRVSNEREESEVQGSGSSAWSRELAWLRGTLGKVGEGGVLEVCTLQTCESPQTQKPALELVAPTKDGGKGKCQNENQCPDGTGGRAQEGRLGKQEDSSDRPAGRHEDRMEE